MPANSLPSGLTTKALIASGLRTASSWKVSRLTSNLVPLNTGKNGIVTQGKENIYKSYDFLFSSFLSRQVADEYLCRSYKS